MDSETTNTLKECVLKLKETALTLALTHHSIKNNSELHNTSRDIADTLASVSSLALVLQGLLK